LIVAGRPSRSRGPSSGFPPLFSGHLCGSCLATLHAAPATKIDSRRVLRTCLGLVGWRFAGSFIDQALGELVQVPWALP
jgi:hypothetical protein